MVARDARDATIDFDSSKEFLLFRERERDRKSFPTGETRERLQVSTIFFHRFFFSLDINLLVNLRQRVEEASQIAAPKIILDSSAAVADK